MKTKVASIFLLLTLIAPIAVTFTFLHYQKQIIRKEVKKQIIAGIEKENLVLLSFTDEEAENLIEWEHSKEFEFNNIMYDIVYQKKTGDTTYYWCWEDSNETEINSNLENLLSRDSKTKQNKERLANFFKSLFFNQTKDIITTTFSYERICFYYQNNLKSIFLIPISPPPINT